MKVGDARKFLSEFFKRADKDVSKLTAKQLATLIDVELAGAKRQSVLMRIHQRFNIMRSQDERARLKNGAVKWKL